jgi:hypothetical protein
MRQNQIKNPMCHGGLSIYRNGNTNMLTEKFLGVDRAQELICKNSPGVDRALEPKLPHRSLNFL